MISRLLWWLNILLAGITALALLSPEVSPFSFWPVAFAGLAFPTLVIFNCLFLFFWMLLLNKRLLLSLAMLAISFPHISAFVRMPEEAVSADRDRSLCVVNYNLLGGDRIYSEDAKAFRQNLELFGSCVLEGVDLIAIQETPAYYKVREGVSGQLNERGLLHHFYPKGIHVSLHCRYPLLEKKVLRKYNDLNAMISALIVPSEGDTLQVMAVHLQSNALRFEARSVLSDASKGNKRAYWKVRNVAANYRAAARKRTEQVQFIKEQIAQSPYPVILLGDLNDTPMSYAIGELEEAGLADSFSESGSGLGITYPGTIPGLRIDYAFASRSMPWLDSRVLDCHFSDHKPIRATLRLRS